MEKKMMVRRKYKIITLIVALIAMAGLAGFRLCRPYIPTGYRLNIASTSDKWPGPAPIEQPEPFPRMLWSELLIVP